MEDGGLRCPFHGWLFDVTGACLETPAEPPTSTFHTRVCQVHYPVTERNGIVWSRQHRGVMLRVIDEPPGPATRIENRAGDPAANPYLYLASQILSGLDGIDAKIEPPPPSEMPYEAEAGPLLPRTLGDAIEAFDRSSFYRHALGDETVDYLVTLKGSEWSRFGAAVTDWEQREYYDTF